MPDDLHTGARERSRRSQEIDLRRRQLFVATHVLGIAARVDDVFDTARRDLLDLGEEGRSHAGCSGVDDEHAFSRPWSGGLRVTSLHDDVAAGACDDPHLALHVK